jgi:hypothetical protein
MRRWSCSWCLYGLEFVNRLDLYIVRDGLGLFTYHGGSLTVSVKGFLGEKWNQDLPWPRGTKPNLEFSFEFNLYLVKKLHMFLLWNFLCILAHTNESITLWSLDSAIDKVLLHPGNEFQLVWQHTFSHENLTVIGQLPPDAAVFAGNTLCWHVEQ